MVTTSYVQFHYPPHTTVTEIFELIFDRSLCSLSAFEIISDILLDSLDDLRELLLRVDSDSLGKSNHPMQRKICEAGNLTTWRAYARKEY